MILARITPVPGVEGTVLARLTPALGVDGMILARNTLARGCPKLKLKLWYGGGCFGRLWRQRMSGVL